MDRLVVLRPDTWVTLPGTHLHVYMLPGGQDYPVVRRPDGTWPLWSVPWPLLVRVGERPGVWPIGPMPLRR